MLERVEQRLPSDFGELTPLGRAQYLEIMTFLDGYLLHSQGDRMLMGNSVEGRFPFLDHPCRRVCGGAPGRAEDTRAAGEVPAPEGGRAVLPPEIAARRKRPYRAPIVSAFVGPRAPDYVRELLDARRLREAGVLQPEAVARLVAKCEAAERAGVGETDEMGLVGTISVMLLHDRFVAQPDLAARAEPTRVVVGDCCDEPSLRRAGRSPLEAS